MHEAQATCERLPVSLAGMGEDASLYVRSPLLSAGAVSLSDSVSCTRTRTHTHPNISKADDDGIKIEEHVRIRGNNVICPLKQSELSV